MTKYEDGKEEVLLAVSEFIANGGTLDARNFAEFAKSFEPAPNPFVQYSLELLYDLQRRYSSVFDFGSKLMVDGGQITYAEALQFVGEAIEIRKERDFCSHGQFKWQEALCGYCESGE
jgi:hypothetical protein